MRESEYKDEDDSGNEGENGERGRGGRKDEERNASGVVALRPWPKSSREEPN